MQYLKKVFVQILVASLLLISINASADCIHNGVVYPEGTIIGDSVCIGGKWVKR